MAPEPYEFCNVLVRSLVGDKEDDRFTRGEEPVLRVTVTNKNGPECRVAVEVESETGAVLVGRSRRWRSEEKRHGGEKSRGKRQWPYEVPLQLLEKGEALQLTVRVLMCGLGQDEPALIGEYVHAIWVR